MNKKISQKDAKAIIYKKLATAMSEFKKDFKPKKFESKLKKASKLFATDIAKTKKVKIKVKTKAKPASKETQEAGA